MKTNPVKRLLAAGKPTIGTWLSLGDCRSRELAGERFDTDAIRPSNLLSQWLLSYGRENIMFMQHRLPDQAVRPDIRARGVLRGCS